MNYPTIYNPDRIGTLFYSDLATVATAAADANLTPAAQDEQTVRLVIIDMQVDFCHPDGSLHVPGAREDIRRLIEFIYRHAGRITQITCSLDSHLPHQIFHPAWWIDEQGSHPAPFTQITHNDVAAGRWRALIEPEYSAAYVQKLEEQAKKQLTIWPYHVLIGSMGQALDPELFTAVFWHSVARQTQPNWLHKGSIPQTEHYSAVQPELPLPGQPTAGRNQAFLDNIAQADLVLIAGEASSHCVLESVEDLVKEFSTTPDVLQKIYMLRDCMSPVVHPEIDFAALTQTRFAEFEQQGINFIDSSEGFPAL
jgi:nicotinamidase/pyrazinamidase